MSKADRRRKRIGDEDESGTHMDVDDANNESTTAGDAGDDEDERPSKKSKTSTDFQFTDVLNESSEEEPDDPNDSSASGGSDGEDDDASGSGSASDGGGGGPPDDGYDDEGYGDEEDRARLAAMSEIDRQTILLERHDKRAQAKERYEARKAEREAKRSKKEKKRSKKEKKKSKASSKKKRSKKEKESSEKESGRKTRGRSSTSAADKKRTADAALADLLARKNQKTTSSKANDSKRFKDEDDEEEDEDADMEDVSEDEEDRRARRKSSKKSRRREEDYEDDEDVKDVAEVGGTQEYDADEIPQTRTPVTYAHIKSIQLRRNAFEKIMDEPYFADVTKGMFVRLSVGTHPQTQQPVYRLCRIKDVTHESKVKYKFGVPPRETRIGLLLQFGKAEKMWPLTQMSNQSVTQDEFEKYKAQCEYDGIEMITQEETLQLKRKAASTRQNFQYSPDVIAKLIEERRAQGKTLAAKTANLTAERARLEFEINAARDSGNSEQLVRLQNQLDALEEAEKRLKEQSQEKKSVQLAHGILEINRRNIKENTDKMEQMKRMLREAKRAEEEAAKKQQLETGAAPAPPKRDAFKRKETRPTMEFIADAEKVAEKNKAALAKEKAEKEAEKVRLAAEAKLKAEQARKNRLDQEIAFIQPSSDYQAQAHLEKQTAKSCILHLSYHQSASDRLVDLLRQAHSSIRFDELDLNNHSLISQSPAITGRFLTTTGGFAPTDPSLPQAAPGQTISFDEWRSRRQQ